LNQKKIVKSANAPEYLHSIDIDVEDDKGRITGHRLVAGQVVKVRRGVNRPAGDYVFRYAEYNQTLGEHLLYVESLSRMKCCRAEAIRKVIGSRG